MNKSATLRSRKLLTTLLATIALSISIPATASAVVVDGPWTYYSTADLCKFSLTPPTADVQTGNLHTVAATVMSSGVVPPFAFGTNGNDVFNACVQGNLAALEGAPVKFSVTSGPNAGTTGDGQLDASGQARFSYSSQLIGHDEIEASIELPDICVSQFDESQLPSEQGSQPLDTETACNLGEQEQPIEFEQTCLLAEVDPCQPPVETLKATAGVNWFAPVVVAAAKTPDPKLAISRVKRCVKGVFTVTPTYTGGQIQSSSLFVGGRRVQVLTSQTDVFRINGKRFKPGKHNFEVVTVFSDGRAASKFGAFTRCAVKSRVVNRRVSPRFTG